MHIAVASNLCGNLPALESFLWELEKLKDGGKVVTKVYIIGILGPLPCAREVFTILSKLENVVLIKGKFDELILKSDEKLNLELPRYIKDCLRWNLENLGSEGRRWLMNLKDYHDEKFGEFNFHFRYDNPVEPGEELENNMPQFYYEKIHEQFKQYKMLFIAGKSSFHVLTQYGKIVSLGPIGFKVKRKNPVFAVIDTDTTSVSYFEIKFDEFDIKDRLDSVNFPKGLKKSILRSYTKGNLLDIKIK